MAKKRVKVDTSRLRSMAETQRVVARPVDSYIRPALDTRAANQSKQIFSALSAIEPKLQKFISDGKEEFKSSEEEKGEKFYSTATPEERKAFEDAIKKGEIPETYSPFWAEGFSRSLLRNHAKEFGDSLYMEWDKQKDTDGFDFPTWAAGQRKKYSEDNKLDGFRSDMFNEEFGGVTEAFESQIRQQNFQHQLQKARDGRMESFRSELETVHEGFGEQIDSGNFDPIAGADVLNQKIQKAKDDGVNITQLLEDSTQYIQGVAQEMANRGEDYEPYLQVLENLKLKGSTYGIANKYKLETLRENLARDRESAINRDHDQAVKADTARVRIITQDIRKQLIEGKFADTIYNSPENKKLRDELAIIDPTAAQNLDTFFQKSGRMDEVSDPDTVDDIMETMAAGTDTEAIIDKAVDDGKLSGADALRLTQLNDGVYNGFIKDYGLSDVLTGLASSIKQKDTLTSLLSDESHADLASQARSELQQGIMKKLARVGTDGYTQEKAAKEVLELQTKLMKKYKDLAQARVEEDFATVSITDDAYTKWQNKEWPWRDAEGGWVKNPEQLHSLIKNLQNEIKQNPDGVGAFIQSTNLGQFIAPYIAHPDIKIEDVIDAIVDDIVAHNSQAPEEEETSVSRRKKARTGR